MTDFTPGVVAVAEEAFFRQAMSDALAAVGIACATAGTREQALREAENPAVGVVVLDLQLSGGSGLDLLERLRALRDEIRVIVLSTATDQDLVLQALRTHACDYLAKPLHEEELVLTVGRALRSYRVEASRAALRERLGRLETQLASLSEILGADASSSRKDEIARWSVEAVATVLGATKTSLMLLDDGGEQLRVAAATGSTLPPGEMDAVKTGQGVAGLAVSDGTAMVVADVAEDSRFVGRSERKRYASGSFALAPCFGAGEARGVLCAADREGGAPFTEDDLTLLRILAQRIGEILGQAQAGPQQDREIEGRAAGRSGESDAPVEQNDDAATDSELARAVCDVLANEIDPTRIVDAALRPMVRALSAAPVSLHLIDNGVLVMQGQCEGGGSGDRPRLPVDRGLTGTVLQTGRMVAAQNPESDPRFDAECDTPSDGSVMPLLCVPLRLRGRIVGVARAFAVADIRPSAARGEMLSAALSAAVRNVLLYRSLLESIDDVAEARREARGRENR